jgi:hypothetical protein
MPKVYRMKAESGNFAGPAPARPPSEPSPPPESPGATSTTDTSSIRIIPERPAAGE